MQTALLQYPIDKVFLRLQKILKRKGFVIISSNEMQGKIRAHKRRFFQQSLSLDINASRIDDQAARIDLSINSEPNLLSRKMTFEKGSEEELWNSIYNAF